MFDMLGLQFLALFEGGLNWKSFQQPLHWWLFLVSLCRLVSNNASREIEKGFGDMALTPTGLRISWLYIYIYIIHIYIYYTYVYIYIY